MLPRGIVLRNFIRGPPVTFVNTHLAECSVGKNSQAWHFSGISSVCRHSSYTMHSYKPQMARTTSEPAGKRSYHDDPAKKARVEEDKAKFMKQNLGQRREQYKCGSKFVPLENVLTWPQYAEQHAQTLASKGSQKEQQEFSSNKNLSDKVSIWRGDITVLEIDAIGNAANNSLLGGGGVDGCIHRAAGIELKRECALLHGCETGDAKITLGYKLPARHVIHTVGPIGKHPSQLKSCYSTCLRLLKENKLKSLAMPCISTGIYGYPNYDAANVALRTVREWLETDENADLVDRIIFCLFLKEDVKIYERLMQVYFPLVNKESKVQNESVSPKAKMPKNETDEENTEGKKKDEKKSESKKEEEAEMEIDEKDVKQTENTLEEKTPEEDVDEKKQTQRGTDSKDEKDEPKQVSGSDKEEQEGQTEAAGQEVQQCDNTKQTNPQDTQVKGDEQNTHLKGDGDNVQQQDVSQSLDVKQRGEKKGSKNSDNDK